MSLPFKFKFTSSINELPVLPLQILETYPLGAEILVENGIINQVRKSEIKVKKIKSEDVMQYIELEEIDSIDEEELDPSFFNHWKNLLIWGDNLYVLNSLKEKLANKIQLIYIDPPFYTGTNEIIDIPIGASISTIKQGPSPIQDVAYLNIWKTQHPEFSFSQWLYDRIKLMHSLLKPTGFIAVRFDYHFGHYAKIVLDEVFEPSNFICEYLVRRMTKTVSDKNIDKQNHLIIQSDSIFLFRKTPKAKFYQGVIKGTRKNQDTIEIEDNNNNVWLDIVGYEKTKKTLYPTENSIKLLTRIIKLCSQPKDIVADFFCGSGTTMFVAHELDRYWIGGDLSRYAINEVRKRMLTVNNQQVPFQLINLEMYKKHLLYLQLKENNPTLQLQEEYYRYIVESFGGTYVKEYDRLHGKVETDYIHVGSIDSIVSPTEIQETINEVKRINGTSLIILGWDYMMEVSFFKRIIQEEHNINVRLKIIPNTLLHGSNDQHNFNDLPYIDIRHKLDPKTRTIELTINDFRLSHAGSNPEWVDKYEVGSLDLIDFWAVDWDYRPERLFVANNYSFRKIGAGRSIREGIKSKFSHTFTKPGNYTILITVVDVLGNDTTEYFQTILT